MAKRIKLERLAGWRMPENAVKVDRSTKWGNPFKIEAGVSREEAVALHRSLLTNGKYRETPSCSATDSALYAIGVKMEIEQLRGLDLACWCPLDKPCHADVLLELANA